jgi:ribonuclease D
MLFILQFTLIFKVVNYNPDKSCHVNSWHTFCEQQIETENRAFWQIISKNTQSAKNKKASQSQQTTFSKSSRDCFSGLQIRTGLGGTYSSSWTALELP